MQLAAVERRLHVVSRPGLGGESDEALIVEYAATRRPALFAELVRRHEKKLYGYVSKFLGDPELAMDVTQSTLLQLHLKNKGICMQGLMTISYSTTTS